MPPLVVAYRTFVTGHPPRPLLGMRLTGVNGLVGGAYGLIDSGADSTSMPFGYASLMGYTPDKLQPEQVGQVAGSVSCMRAKEPSKAVIPEIPDVEVEILPIFVPGAQTILWGRMDFMRVFNVTIYESQQQFAIEPCTTT